MILMVKTIIQRLPRQPEVFKTQLFLVATVTEPHISSQRSLFNPDTEPEATSDQPFILGTFLPCVCLIYSNYCMSNRV